jgi:hypothetical protein
MVFLFPNAYDGKHGGDSFRLHAERINVSAAFAHVLVTDIHIGLQDAGQVQECRLVSLVGSDDLGVHP